MVFFSKSIQSRLGHFDCLLHRLDFILTFRHLFLMVDDQLAIALVFFCSCLDVFFSLLVAVLDFFMCFLFLVKLVFEKLYTFLMSISLNHYFLKIFLGRKQLLFSVFPANRHVFFFLRWPGHLNCQRSDTLPLRHELLRILAKYFDFGIILIVFLDHCLQRCFQLGALSDDQFLFNLGLLAQISQVLRVVLNCDIEYFSSLCLGVQLINRNFHIVHQISVVLRKV